MTSTHCDRCGVKICTLTVPAEGDYGCAGESPGFKVLLPHDLTCARVMFRFFDLCQGCVIEVGRFVRRAIDETASMP